MVLRKSWMVTAAVVLAVAVPSRAANLLDVVKLAVDGDPEFKSAEHQNRADAEKTRQAWARFLPHVKAQGSYDFTAQDIVSSDNSVYKKGTTSYPGLGYEVTLDVSLFNYANWSSLSSARATVRRSNAEFEAAKQDLLLRVAERYFTALSAMEMARSAGEESKALKEHLDIAVAKQQHGLVRDAEMMDARARFLQVQAKQLQADSAVRDAMQALRETSGEAPLSLNALSEDLVAKPLTPDDAEHWLKVAREHNPSIQASHEEVARADHDRDTEVAGWYPSADLEAFHNRRKTDGTLFGGGSDIQNQGVMLKLNIPIYEGGATSSKITEAEQLLGKARSDEVRAMRAVERKTLAAIDGIKTSSLQLEALRASVKAQRKVVEALRTAYQSGGASGMDVLDAERDLFYAQSEFTRSRYDYALNVLRLRRQVGLLDISDLEEMNKLLVADPISVGKYVQVGFDHPKH